MLDCVTQLQQENDRLQAELAQLRASEKRYRTLFELGSEGIVRFGYSQPIPLTLPIDEQLQLCCRSIYVAEANDAYARMYEYEKAEDVVGLTLNDLHAPNSEITQASMLSWIENRYTCRSVETEEIDRFGRKRYFLNSGASTIAHGCVVSTWVSQVDITQLRETQQALLEAEQKRVAQLERANNALQSTVAALALRRDLDGFIGEVLHAIAREFESPLVEYWTVLETDTVEIDTWLYDNRLFALKHDDEHPGRGGIRLSPESIDFEDFTRRCQPLVFKAPIPAYSLALGQVICPTQWYAAHGVSKHFNFPLQAGNTTVGTITVWLPQERQITEECLRLGQALSHQTALAIQLTQLAEEAKQTAIAKEREKAAQEQAAELAKANEALRSAIAGLARLDNLDSFLAEMLKVSLEVTGAHSGAVCLIEGDFVRHAVLFDKTGWVSPEIQAERGTLLLPFSLELRLMAQRSLESEDAWVVLPDDPLHPPSFQTFHREQGSRAIRLVPMRISNRLLGWLGLGFAQEEPPLGRSFALLRVLAEQMTMAVEMLRLAEEAKQTAIAKEQELAAQERAAELAKANEVLRRTASQLVGQQDLNHFLESVIFEVAQETGAVTNAVFLYNDQFNSLLMSSAICDGQIIDICTEPRFELWKAPVPANYNEGWSIVQSRGYTWHELEDSSVFSDEIWDFSKVWHREMQHRCVMSVFLQVGNQPLGFMGLCFREAVQLSTERIELVRALADQAALAIQLTQLAEEAKQVAIAREQERAAQERAAELAKANESLRRSLNQLANDRHLDSLLEHILREALQMLNGATAQLFLYDSTSETIRASLGVDERGTILPAPGLVAQVTTALSFPAKNWSGWTYLLERRCPVYFDIDRDRDYFLPEYLEYHRRQGHCGSVCTALMLGEESLGFLGLVFRDRNTFSTSEFEFFQALAQQATLAIQLTRLAEEAKQVAILEERNRMARDIHDSLAQAFTGIIMQLEAAKRKIATHPETAHNCLIRARSLAASGLSEARRSVRALRPEVLDSNDLSNALRHIVEQMSWDTQVRIQLQIEGTPRPIPVDVEVNLLRIGQEAMTNALRHADAQNLRLNLLFEPAAVHLQICDDGAGFEPQTQLTGGFGLIGMQERSAQIGGQFRLVSSIGRGTEVIVTVPI